MSDLFPGFDAAPWDMDELWDYLQFEIAKNGLDYADSFRATPWERGIEEHVNKQTCCGVFESTHRCRSGNYYYIGCNYGH